MSARTDGKEIIHIIDIELTADAQKVFELKDHLQEVLSTINPKDSGTLSCCLPYFDMVIGRSII